jgi:Domain of unknown function (DUF5655)
MEPMMENSYKVNDHFDGKEPVVAKIYQHLLKHVRLFGPVKEDPKKTSIHLNNVTAFAGVATRKNAIILTIKSDKDIDSPRIHRSEQASARRFHHEIRLTEPSDVNAELIRWLKKAYALSG